MIELGTKDIDRFEKYLQGLTEGLSEQERRIIYWRYFANKKLTIPQIADRLALPDKTVFDIEKAALSRMKEASDGKTFEVD